MSQKADGMSNYKEEANNYALSREWPTLKQKIFKVLTPDVDFDEMQIPAYRHARSDDIVAKCEAYFDSSHWPLFVRSCPVVPRPGVLPSVKVVDSTDLYSTVLEIITLMTSPDTSAKPQYKHGFVDPEGSIMVMPYIDADASAVVSTRHHIIMGRDNDGVTAGKDGLLVAIPVQHDKYVEQDFAYLGLDPDKIEVEFVSELNNKHFDYTRDSYGYSQKNAMVQLRGSAGPRSIVPPPKGVTISGTFHGAERITIEHIHLVPDKSEEHLAMMEDELRKGMPSNSVVVHINGNHLSHHAGQCMDAGVPYIAICPDKDCPQHQRPVAIGDKWTQAAAGWVVLDMDESFTPQPYDCMDYMQEFMDGFATGFTNFGRQHGWLSNIFHQFIGGPIMDPAIAARLGGAYTAWLINATLSVGIGEVRHITSSAYDFTMLPMATLFSIYGKDVWEEANISQFYERKHYYAAIETRPIDIPSASLLFDVVEEVFRGNWQGGYGGLKYATSIANASDLLKHVIAFKDSPTRDNFKAIISSANMTEHNVHNNGFFFNKFISEQALNWGTDPTKVTVTPKDFFSVYYAARDVMERKPRAVHNHTDVLQASKEMTLSDLPSLHEHPLFTDAMHLMANSEYLDRYIHPRGKYSDGKQFIPCNMDGCKVCAAQEQKLIDEEKLKQLALAQSTTSGIIHTAKYYDAPFPSPPKESLAQEHLVKALSKTLEKGGTVSDANLKIVAHWAAKNTLDASFNKYLANLVVNLTSEQLTTFALAMKEE